MAYYDAFKAKWATAPAGTTQSKLDWINAQTVNGPAIRMIVPNYEIYNRIDRGEYTALTAQNESAVQRNLGVPTVDYSANGGLRPFFLTLFPAGSKTQQNLAPYIATFDTPQIPWWKANGYTAAFNMADVQAAGVS